MERGALAAGIAVIACAVLAAPAAAVTATPTSVSFGTAVVGQTATRTVTLTRDVQNNPSINAISLSGSADFTFTPCAVPPFPLSSQGCDVTVSFNPGSRGLRQATLTIEASDGTTNVPLSGTGVAPVVSVAPSSIPFGAQKVGTTSATQTVSITNTTSDSGQTLQVTSISGASDAFAISADGCTLASLTANGGHCTFAVSFAPTAGGPAQATLAIATNDPVHPTVNVSLSGTGTVPDLSWSASSLAFGAVTFGSTPTQTVSLFNGGNSVAALSAPVLAGANAADFAVAGTACGSTLAAGGSCTVEIRFQPAHEGPLVATLDVPGDDPAPPAPVSLGGEGVAPAPPAQTTQSDDTSSSPASQPPAGTSETTPDTTAAATDERPAAGRMVTCTRHRTGQHRFTVVCLLPKGVHATAADAALRLHGATTARGTCTARRCRLTSRRRPALKGARLVVRFTDGRHSGFAVAP